MKFNLLWSLSALLISYQAFRVTASYTTIEYYISADDNKAYSPPINSTILEYISNNINKEDCTNLYSFLVVRDSAVKLHKAVNLSATFQYANYLQKIHLRQSELNEKPFDCLSSLEYWNYKLVGQFTKDMIDRNDFAETILRVSLNSIARKDLGEWVHQYTLERRHRELMELQNEIQSHSSKQAVNSNHSSDSEQDNQNNKIIFLIIFIVIGTIFIITLCLVIKFWSSPKSNAFRDPNFQMKNQTRLKVNKKRKAAKTRPNKKRYGDASINDQDQSQLLLNLEV